MKMKKKIEQLIKDYEARQAAYLKAMKDCSGSEDGNVQTLKILSRERARMMECSIADLKALIT